MKIHVIDNKPEYVDMFLRNGYEVERRLLDADVLCFTGGADVSPDIYGEEQEPRTFCKPERDLKEQQIFHTYTGMKKIGICRGAQFLNVMSGGKLHQHVEGHGRTHIAVDLRTRREMPVTSTHHQMMRLAPGANLLMSANVGHFDDKRKGYLDQDIEAVWYDHTQCLCFQPHPEYGHKPTEEIFMEYVDEFIR